MNHPPRQPILIAGLALALAALACLASGPGEDALPTVSFSTATPGGRLSVSLLSPTAPWPALDQATTPIGPVATATAAAATAAAQTATAAVPSPTLPGIFTEPAQCPPPGTPTLPTQAPAFSRYAEIAVQYLSDGGAPTILEATLRSWGALTGFGGLVRADRDFTGDGVPEVMVLAYDPDQIEETPRPGDLYIFGCQDGAYRLFYQAGYALGQGMPLIHSADDINGDYLNDLVYSVETCGVNTCSREVRVVEWSLTLGNFNSLVNEEIVEPMAEVIVSDVDEDGLQEINVTRGLIDAPNAGPQRSVTTVWKWNGVLYVVAEVIRSPVEYRIHLIHDGDEALLAGEYEAAVEFYRQAVEDDLLLSWEYPNEELYLGAFARYRMMLTYVVMGDVQEAQAVYDDLMTAHLPALPTPSPEAEEPLPEGVPTPTPEGAQPGVEFARLADFFWREFAINRNIARACDIVVGYTRANPELLDVLNSFGFTNPQYAPEDMCPFTGEAAP